MFSNLFSKSRSACKIGIRFASVLKLQNKPEYSWAMRAGIATSVIASIAYCTQPTISACETPKDKFANSKFYPPIASYEQGTIKVSDIHTVAYSMYGNPKGKPVLVVHGGPGGGTCPGKLISNYYYIII